MRRFYKIEVDCANCAAKIERKAKKLEGVNDLNINFMTQKMMLDANDDIFEQKLEEIKRNNISLDEQIKEKTEYNTELMATKDNLNSEEYIEKIAREKTKETFN